MDVSDSQKSVRQLQVNSRGVKKDGLKMYYTNSGSLRNKIDLLREKACVEEFDLIAITATWVDIVKKNFMSELEIAGHQMFHRHRNEKRGREGG